MVIEEEVLRYSEWFPEALRAFGQTAFLVALVALVISYLVSAFRYGPVPGGELVVRSVFGVAIDLVHLSPRRIWALARLSMQEAMRRRVWVTFVAFAVILLFAGWFLDPASSDPGPLYLTFVLSWTTYLVLLLALFISTFSLPGDIKNKTIYTVVTKPVRAGEIVLGRIIGFSVIGSVLLAVMALSSYLFVVRALDHTHELHPADLTVMRTQTGEDDGTKQGRTSEAQRHRHEATVGPDGSGETSLQNGHWHYITGQEVDGNWEYVVGPHEGMLVARVPVMGDLRFLNRDGQPSEKGQKRTGIGRWGGINVGKEWGYRDFIEGGTNSAAIWTFDNIDENALFPDVAAEDRELPLEMRIRVFRTYQGKIDQGISGSISLRNPHTQVESAPRPFIVEDNKVDQMYLARKIPRKNAAEGDAPLDIYDDLVHNGQIEVILRCLEPAQFLGAAPADMYIHAGNAPFEWNVVKGYLGIWFQMVLVIGLGVMFSTFLSGAVAMLATLGCIVLGFFTRDIGNLFKSVIESDRKLVAGGGPIESFVRLITQKTITVEYEPSVPVQIMLTIDKLLLYIMKAFTDVVPDFSKFSNVNYVASGFNVPSDLVLQQATIMITYLAGAFLAGFIFLRMREVAR